MTDGYEPGFDVDRPYGEEGERILADLLNIPAEKVEVKRKRRRDFGFYVETAQSPGATGEYKPSGLNVTRAEFWGFVIADTGVAVLIPTKRLKAAALLSPEKSENDGDNPTKGRLIHAEDLFGAAHDPPPISYEAGCGCETYYPLVDIYGNERCMICDCTRVAA